MHLIDEMNEIVAGVCAVFVCRDIRYVACDKMRHSNCFVRPNGIHLCSQQTQISKFKTELAV